jgi:uncharacterized protein YggE
MRTITFTLRLPGERARWLAGGLVTGLLFAAIASPAFAPRSALAVDPPTAPEHTISVSGVGKVVVGPDTADIQLGVTVSKSTVKAARQGAAAKMTKVLAALKKLGIADKDLQTTTLSLQPNYAYSNNSTPRLTGYTLSNGITVTVRDLDKIGDAIDDALAAGATSLDGVSFRVDDPAAAQKQARTEAMAQAKANADTLASAAGVSIVGVASISETTAPTPYPIYYGAMKAAAIAQDTSTPVQVGTSEVTITVMVAYLIG